MEPARSTLYRSFLLAVIPAAALFGALLRLTALVALAAAWTAFLVASWIAARRARRGIDVRRELYPSAFEEDPVTVDLVVSADRPARMIEVADAFGPALSVEQRMLEPGPITPDDRRRLSYQSFCSRHWGVYPVGPIRVVASDPAGLFHAEHILPAVGEFAVFPRVYDVAGLLPEGARATLATGEATSSRPGQSLLYLGVRDYRPGDDLRRVHWPASARRGALVVKEFEVDLAPYFTLFLDLDRRHRAGTGKKSTLEYVVRTGCSVAWTAARAGSYVQILGEGRRPLYVPPGRGETHLTFALYELIQAVQDGQMPLHEVVLHHLSAVPERSTAVVVSASAFLDLAAMDEVLESFRVRGVRPLFILVNNFSFPAIEGWPPPRAEVLEKTREVVFFLRSRGVPVRLLQESDDLEAALGRAGFSE